MGWERGGSAGPGAVKEGVRGVPRSKSMQGQGQMRGGERGKVQELRVHEGIKE